MSWCAMPGTGGTKTRRIRCNKMKFTYHVRVIIRIFIIARWLILGFLSGDFIFRKRGPWTCPWMRSKDSGGQSRHGSDGPWKKSNEIRDMCSSGVTLQSISGLRHGIKSTVKGFLKYENPVQSSFDSSYKQARRVEPRGTMQREHRTPIRPVKDKARSLLQRAHLKGDQRNGGHELDQGSFPEHNRVNGVQKGWSSLEPQGARHPWERAPGLQPLVPAWGPWHMERTPLCYLNKRRISSRPGRMTWSHGVSDGRFSFRPTD